MIACQTSVLVARAKITQETLRKNENKQTLPEKERLVNLSQHIPVKFDLLSTK